MSWFQDGISGWIYQNCPECFRTFHRPSIISNYTYPSTELLDRTNIVYMFKCRLGDCVSKENNTYVGLTSTSLSKRLAMYLNDSISITLHLKTHSIPKSKFRKILVENTTIIAHLINKLRLQILEALHIKTKNLESIELILKIATFWNAFSLFFCFLFFFLIQYFFIIVYFRW